MMLSRTLFILFCFFGYVPNLMAEQQHSILRKLATLKGNVQVINNSKKLPFFIPDLPSGFNEAGYGIVKTGSGLFILPQGTGRVYEYNILEDRWQRIDSSYFTGYNFGSIQFGYANDIYSFGGYGLWHTNGMLRIFNPGGGEWNTITTNRYIPWKLKSLGRANFYMLDTATGRFIINGLGINGIQTLKDQSEVEIGNDIYALGLKDGYWKKLGSFRDTVYEMIGFLPWGILNLHGEVADLNGNRYYRLTGSALSRLQAITYKALQASDNLISFCYDSTLYLARDGIRYDSLTISRADLTDLGIAVYEPHDPGIFERLSSFRDYAVYFLAIAVGFVVGVFFRKKQVVLQVESHGAPSQPQQPHQSTVQIASPTQAVADKTEITPQTEKTIAFRSSKLLELLEEKERSLLEFIYLYSAEERLTTIEEINKVIGAGSRSAEIQKRMRSDLIGSINQKMGLLTRDKKPVIDKQRSEFDKRSFEYFIRNEHMELVERVLGSK